MAECTDTIAPTATASRPSLWVRLRRVPANVFSVLLRWQERADERHALESLSEHMLKDMGIGRGDAASEARKPFWRE